VHAGIPARIVTALQVAEINPVDQVLTVSQRDAHAWTEVWLRCTGWIRIDPYCRCFQRSGNRFGMEFITAETRSPRAIANNDRLCRKVGNSAKNNWDALNSAWDMWGGQFMVLTDSWI